MANKIEPSNSFELAALKLRLEREKSARHQAEKIAEAGLRELYSQKRQLEFLNQIVMCLNGPGNISDILQEICSHLGIFLGFKIGRICKVQGKIKKILRDHIWYQSASDEIYTPFLTFIEATYNAGALTVSSGEASLSRQPLPEISDGNFQHAAAAYGLSVGLSIPIFIGDEIAACIEYYDTDETHTYDDVGLLLKQITSQLSVFLERELIRNQAQLNLSTDIQTGLRNRRCIQESIDEILKSINESEDHGGALMVVGFDGFRIVNDTFGHDVGDMIIYEAIERIKKVLTELPAEVALMMSRIAGDEFAMLFPASMGRVEIERKAHDVIAALNATYTCFAYPLQCTASAGLLHFDRTTRSSVQALSYVDTALQYSKKSGGAQLTVFTDSMRHSTHRSRIIAAKVSRALANDDFSLQFQPQISVTDRKLVGVEVLLRWKELDGGFLNPSDFLPIADRLGLTIPIDKWVLKNSLAIFSKWKHFLSDYPSFKLSINVSPAFFMQSDFFQQCLELVNLYEINPNNICFEIIETTILENNSVVSENFDLLRKYGFSISIDDFGTGYSSLSYLKKYQPDTIKIDKEFIINISTNQDNQKIVSAIIELANTLNVSIVAEGVENKEDLDFLESLNCEIAQGYYFSRPLKESDTVILLNSPPKYWN